MKSTYPSYYITTEDLFNNCKSLDSVEITCQTCFKNFKTTKKNILKGLKDRDNYVQFCSAKCSNTARFEGNRQEVNCKHCNKTFSKTKSEIEKVINNFCSRSCAASYNNKTFIKRELTRTCTECSDVVFTYRHTRCKKHHEEYKENNYTNRTIGEYRKKASVAGKHPSWLNSHIRLFARSWNKELLKLPCAKCGYSEHVELAHIKGISTFSDDSLLSNVNSVSNIIQLCPNCHWEFDNKPRDSFLELLETLNKTYSDK